MKFIFIVVFALCVCRRYTEAAVCQTPDGKTGDCKSIYSCPQLLNKLKPPISNENIDYVKKSRCESKIQYSVCCGLLPEPNSTTLIILDAFPPDSETKPCGIDSRGGSLIIGGGTATDIDQYPWLVNIEYESEDGTSLLCGGTLISGKYVLTAAHCVTGRVFEVGKPTRVRLGEYDTANEGKDCKLVEAGMLDCNEGLTQIDIEKIIVHPKYSPTNFQKTNDIALLRMKEIAPYTDFIRPICLPTDDTTESLASASAYPLRFFVAGWGAVSRYKLHSNIKLHVELPFVPLDRCQEIYNDIESNKTLWRGQLCAGGEFGKEACRGDSGGPLMYQKHIFYEILGVVSYGIHPCGESAIPGVYSKVYEYLDWIKESIVP